jgi:hypothetical protein
VFDVIVSFESREDAGRFFNDVSENGSVNVSSLENIRSSRNPDGGIHLVTAIDVASVTSNFGSASPTVTVVPGESISVDTSNGPATGIVDWPLA